ncbi:hypothetical protein C0989_008588 [Termitomyces sp. Mn162]|nr:hypothetical protein C0989_008588 [Termitomyces sp. Mn162]
MVVLSSTEVCLPCYPVWVSQHILKHPKPVQLQLIMGPDTYNISSMKFTVPKLAADGSNWLTHQEHVQNAVTPKELCQHLMGTVHKQVELIENEGSFYQNKGSLNLLSDEEIEELEDTMEE